MHRRVNGVWLRIALALLVGSAGLQAKSAQADGIAYDGFNYPAGFFLSGQSGGVAWSGAYGGDQSLRSATIVNGSLPYGGLAVVGNAIQTASSTDGQTNNVRTFSTSIGANGTTAYLSFLIEPTEGVNNGDSGSYAGFSVGNLFVGKLSTGFYGLETVGHTGQVSSTKAPFQNVTALVVVRFTFQAGNDKIDLFVNPAVGQPLPDTPDATKTDLDLGSTNTVQVLADHSVELDEFRMGTTLSDVMPAPTPQDSILLFQNQTTNSLARWFMNGTAVIGSQAIPPTPDAGWKVMATGDFNQDGQQDLVFQEETTGQIAIWFLNGPYFLGGTSVATIPAAGYVVSAAADMDGDGKPDLILQNRTTGALVIWFMNGTTLTGSFNLTSTDPNYRLVATGDFDFNGTADLVFQDQVTNKIVIWTMNRTVLTGIVTLLNIPDAGWKVVASGDYNGDGRSDLVFQNTSTNQIAMWYLDKFTFVGGGIVVPTPLSDYKIVGPH